MLNISLYSTTRSIKRSSESGLVFNLLKDALSRGESSSSGTLTLAVDYRAPEPMPLNFRISLFISVAI